MCSFRGSFSGAAKNVAKLGTFSESAKFFAIFFRFRRFSYSQAGFAPGGAAPAEALWRWREPPFPESECKVRHSYGSLQIFQEKFSRKYVIKHVLEAKSPALHFDWQPLTTERFFLAGARKNSPPAGGRVIIAHLGRRLRASGSVIDFSQLPSPSPSGSYHLGHSDSALTIRVKKLGRCVNLLNFDTPP